MGSSFVFHGYKRRGRAWVRQSSGSPPRRLNRVLWILLRAATPRRSFSVVRPLTTASHFGV